MQQQGSSKSGTYAGLGTIGKLKLVRKHSNLLFEAKNRDMQTEDCFLLSLQ
jgi:hypothetical protein